MWFEDDEKDWVRLSHRHKPVVELDIDHILDLTCRKLSPETRLFYAIILQAAQDIDEFPREILKYVLSPTFEAHCNWAGLDYNYYRKLFLKEIKKATKNGKTS